MSHTPKNPITEPVHVHAAYARPAQLPDLIDGDIWLWVWVEQDSDGNLLRYELAWGSPEEAAQPENRPENNLMMGEIIVSEVLLHVPFDKSWLVPVA